MIPIFIDIISLIILAAYAFSGFRKGFFRSLVNIIGSLLLYVISSVTAKICAPLLYEKFLGPYFMERIENYITNVGDGVRMESIVINALNKIPEFCKDTLLQDTTIEDFISLVTKQADNKIENVTNILVYDYIPTVLIPLLQGAIFILLITLLFFLLRGLITLLGNHAAKKSLIGRIDSVIGAVCGFSIGIIILMVLAFIAQLIIGFTADSAELCNSTLIEKTLLFKLFYHLIQSGIVAS